MNHSRLDAIFIHSLFRAGSTYLFNVFRNAGTQYYCYQEPVHEEALRARSEPERLLALSKETQQSLRHPTLTAPYFQELYEAHHAWKQLLTKDILYDHYFGGPRQNKLTQYLKSLIKSAQGRPVIQECRTSSRIGLIKNSIGGQHIYLWRNPWDQWWSYKTTGYFDVTTSLILNTPYKPCPVQKLLESLDFAEFHSPDIDSEFQHFHRHRLSPSDSYASFYLLWALGLMEGFNNADILINIDSLSTNFGYRSEILKQLENLGVADVDFSECSVPQSYYTDDEKVFFIAQEKRVHSILSACGADTILLDRLELERATHQTSVMASTTNDLPTELLLESLTRARKTVLLVEERWKSPVSDAPAPRAKKTRLAKILRTFRRGNQD